MLSKVFTNNWGLKLTALIITFIMFYFVNSERNNTEITLNIPVKFSNLPEDKFILLPIKRQVQVTLRGPAHKVVQSSSGLFFNVELEEELGNKASVTLSSANLNIPASVNAYNIEPSMLELTFDDVIEKKVEVQTPTIGKVAQSKKLIDLNVEPKQVSLRGPKSELREVNSIETEPLDLRDLEASGEKDLGLRIPSVSLSSEVESVKVMYDILDTRVKKTFKGLKVSIKNKSVENIELIPELVDIELIGLSSLINKLTKSDLSPYVDLNKEDRQDLQSPVLIALPAGVKLVSIEPKEVKLRDKNE